jgi:hypothetical protein
MVIRHDRDKPSSPQVFFFGGANDQSPFCILVFLPRIESLAEVLFDICSANKIPKTEILPMAPKGKGKGKSDGEEKDKGGKVKGAQQINVRHILVSGLYED